MKKDKQRKRDFLFSAGLVMGILFLFWKSKYGTGAYDEPFYLTIPHRIAGGDGMFSEEWNFGQFSSFLMLPLMRIYLLLHGGTEGIVLHFRYFYIVFQGLCTVILYTQLRKKELAWAAAWMFLLFTPYDIMAMSYNTIGLSCMTLTGALLAGAEKNGWKTWVISGILFAAAVLCNPFLAVLYFLYSLMAAAAAWMRRRKAGKEAAEADGTEGQNDAEEQNGAEGIWSRRGVFGGKAWLCITAGAAGLAVLFGITVLCGSSIGELLVNIPLLMDDPEHTSRSLAAVVKVYLQSFWNVYGWFIPVWAVFLFMSCFFRKDGLKRRIAFLLLSLSAAVSILGLLPTIQNSYNFIMVPIAVCGLGAYILTKERDKKSFAFLYIFGLLYTFMANYASNQGMHAISMAMMPADAAAVLFIGTFLKQETETLSGTEIREEAFGRREQRTGKGLLTTAVALLLAVQLGAQFYTKAVHTFWEEPVWRLDTQITEGPLKGTITTKEKADSYQAQLDDIRTHLTKDGPVLFATKDTWCYLYADAEYGTFSSYLSGGLSQAAKRWQVYYEAHPEKIPYYIYIPKEEAGETAAEISGKAEEYGYRMEESDNAYHLYK